MLASLVGALALPTSCERPDAADLFSDAPPPSGPPAVCAGPGDCPNGTVCDLSVGSCVQCLGSGDCPGGQTCEDRICVVPAGCTSDEGCGTRRCDTALSQCVDCLSKSDCSVEQECVSGVCAEAGSMPSVGGIGGGGAGGSGASPVGAGGSIAGQPVGGASTAGVGGSKGGSGAGGAPMGASGEASGTQNGDAGAGPVEQPACDSSTLLIVQASNSMFEPILDNDDRDLWTIVEPLLSGSQSVVADYADSTNLAAGTFFIAESVGECPNLVTTPFGIDAQASADFFEKAGQQGHESDEKRDSATASAIEAGADLLGDQTGRKYLIVILFGRPDSCVDIDRGGCFVDETIAAVQAAWDDDVTTFAVVLESDGQAGQSYTWFADSLARAGIGQPIGTLDEEFDPTDRDQCPDELELRATYSDAPGNAQRYLVPPLDEEAARDQLTEIFDRISECEP